MSTETPELVSPFRLAFRVEGNRVCCYFAKHESMDGAHLMGYIQKSILDVDPSQFEMFKQIMRRGIEAAVKDVIGCDIAKFDESPAPEHREEWQRMKTLEDPATRTMAELVAFIDSGYQSFSDQVHDLPAGRMREAAFFAGAALSLRLMDHFSRMEAERNDGAAAFMFDLVVEEIGDYLERNGVRIEWEPHVPRRMKQ